MAVIHALGKLARDAVLACLFRTWTTMEKETRVLHITTRAWVPKWLVRNLAVALKSGLVEAQLKMWQSEGVIPELTAQLPDGTIRQIGLLPSERGKPWRDPH